MPLLGCVSCSDMPRSAASERSHGGHDVLDRPDFPLTYSPKLGFESPTRHARTYIIQVRDFIARVRIASRRSVLLGQAPHAQGLLGGGSKAGRSASSGLRPPVRRGRREGSGVGPSGGGPAGRGGLRPPAGRRDDAGCRLREAARPGPARAVRAAARVGHLSRARGEPECRDSTRSSMSRFGGGAAREDRGHGPDTPAGSGR